MFINKNRHFRISVNPETTVFTCSHVISGEKEVLFVFHDKDGDWQFLCDKNHSTEDGRIVSLKEILTLDSSLVKVSKLKKGCIAKRKDIDSRWTFICDG